MDGRVAFVGLGIMGRPMAANLVAAGVDLVGYTRTASSRETARGAGIPVADSLDDAVTGADVLVTMLPDGPDVATVLLDDGALELLSPGALVVDMSTVAPETARHVHEHAAQRGLGCLDAPVSGGESAAVTGTVSIMVGGAEPDVERAMPIFDIVGATVVRVGDAGAGQVVKAANQMLVAGHLQMLAEALVFLRAHGVDRERAVDVIGAGLAGSTVIDRKATAMIADSYEPGFRASLHRKDLGIVTDAGRAAGLSLPLTAAVTQLVNALVARGDGDLDHAALHKLATDLNQNGAD